MFKRKGLVLSNWKEALPALAAVSLALILLFGKSFSSDHTLFSNDGPLGQVAAHSVYKETGFAGYWNDIYWVGKQMPSAPFNVTLLIYTVIGPPVFGEQGAVNFLKYYAPLSLLLLGFSAWLFCRQLKLHPVVCVVIGIAAALNINALSNASWGLPAFAITRAMCLLAMSAIVSPAIKRDWMRLVLAGCAVGIGVSEGFDTGAIFSLYLAGFALVWFGLRSGEKSAKGWGLAGVKVAAIAAFAGLMAAHTIITLVNTQLIDTARNEVPAGETAEQKKAREEQAWIFATMASLPKLETLRVFVSGVFGYRMSPDEEHFGFHKSSYWGGVGGSPSIDDVRRQALRSSDQNLADQAKQQLTQVGQSQPSAFRFSGSGEYAGVLVVLLAIWAFLQSVRPAGSTAFSDFDRWMIRFWAAVAVFSLMATWGRHFPLYSLLYNLPFFSTIRNPIKFTQPMHLGLLVLCAYGMQDLLRRCLHRGEEAKKSAKPGLKSWWKKAPSFERGWTIGLGVAFAGSFMCLLLYVMSENDVVEYITCSGFNEEQAKVIANHSFGAVAKYLGWLLVFGGLSVAVLAGYFANRIVVAGAVMGVLLTLDLLGGSQPWIIYENYKERYASNAIIERLAQEPHLNRVSFSQIPVPDRQDLIGRLNGLFQFYFMHWLQNQFPYNRIQSSDIHQDPRPAKSKVNYQTALQTNPVRQWQLTNTRYLLGLPEQMEDMNNRADPVQRRFKTVARFHMVQEPGKKWPTVHVADDGIYALFEFQGVLPRARLFSNWAVVADNEQILKQIAAPSFDPLRMVLIEGTSGETHMGSTNLAPGTVTSKSYTPKRIVMDVNATEEAILLLNDQHHPDWKITINGKAAELLRCNYLMRGVRVPAGQHEIVFRFKPSRAGFYLSLAALFLGVGLLGYIGFGQPVEAADEKENPSSTPRDKNRPETESAKQESKPEDAAGSRPRAKGKPKSKKRRR